MATARSRKTVKRRTASKDVHRLGASADLEAKVARLTRERNEALERETASAEVLKVISSSPGELELVFQAMLENATRVCAATSGLLVRAENDGFRIAASLRQRANIEDMKHRTFKFGPSTPIGRAVRTRQIVHVPNLSEDRAYLEREPLAVWAVEQANVRTVLVVPMLKGEELVGVFGIERDEVRPFTDTQIALVQNFAAQAVIAIENTRLLKDLRESLDRQTATADILRVIAGTPEDSKRSLDTIAETASRMFDVAHVNFRRLEGNVLRIVSSAGSTVVRLREALPDLPLEPTDPVVRSFLDNRQIAVEDRRATLANEHGEIARALRNLPGLPIASQVFTPLSREGKQSAS